MAANGLFNFDVTSSDIEKLFSATNKNLGYKGSYCNYYIANTKVIVPIYHDPNDNTVLQLLQTLYSNRTVIGIDFRNIYANGRMTHCVTPQQPQK